METLKLKKLSNIETEPDFSSESSRHIIVEDGGELKRLDYSAFSSAPFVATFSGTGDNNDAACDKTYAEIKAAYDAGRDIRIAYNSGGVLFYINNYYVSSSSFGGSFCEIPEPENIGVGYNVISCEICSDGSIYCTHREV